MREIVGFQLGNCGNSLGSDFWNCLNYEHGLNENGRFVGDSDLQLERINVYYEEGSGGGVYLPRAVGIDLEGSRLESLLNERSGKMFRPECFIGGREGGSNNYGRGYFSDGHDLLERIMDVSRREVERCDSPQGFQILHGVGGGTGAGLTGLLLERLKDEFMEKMIMSFSVLPSPKVSDIVVEPYNAVLGLRHLVEDTELTFCLDNEALLSSCAHGLGLKAPRFSDLNYLISNAISGITTCLRFPGQLNTGLMKLAVNAVPFPRLHFMIPSYVPLLPRNICANQFPPQIPVRVKDMVRELMHPKCRMVAADTRRGKFLTATSIFRGRMSTREVETSLKLIKDKNSDQFVNWIPDNAKIAICDIAPRGVKRAATFFSNNTSIAAVWVRILEQYRAMYRRRAYLHWYIGEGMEESDFEVAETTMLDLIDEYIPLSSDSFPHDGDGDDNDDDIDDWKRTGNRGGAAGRRANPSPPREAYGGARRASGGGGGGGEGRGSGGRNNGRVVDFGEDFGQLGRISEEKKPAVTSSQASPKTTPKTSPKTSRKSVDERDGNGGNEEVATNAAEREDWRTPAQSPPIPPSPTLPSTQQQEEQLPQQQQQQQIRELSTQPSSMSFYEMDHPYDRRFREPSLIEWENDGEIRRSREDARMEDEKHSALRQQHPEEDALRSDGDVGDVAANAAEDEDAGNVRYANEARTRDGNDDEDDDDDYLSQFVSDVKQRKRKSKESEEFRKIMERKDDSKTNVRERDNNEDDDDDYIDF